MTQAILLGALLKELYGGTPDPISGQASRPLTVSQGNPGLNINYSTFTSFPRRRAVASAKSKLTKRSVAEAARHPNSTPKLVRAAPDPENTVKQELPRQAAA